MVHPITIKNTIPTDSLYVITYSLLFAINGSETFKYLNNEN